MSETGIIEHYYLTISLRNLVGYETLNFRLNIKFETHLNH
jgi:hypothetical protein